MFREEPYRVTFVSSLCRGAVEQFSQAAKLTYRLKQLHSLSRHLEVPSPSGDEHFSGTLRSVPPSSRKCFICASKSWQHLSQQQTDQELTVDRRVT